MADFMLIQPADFFRNSFRSVPISALSQGRDPDPEPATAIIAFFIVCIGRKRSPFPCHVLSTLCGGYSHLD